MTHPAIIVTHGDVDGMICAAQLIRRERSECDVGYSNARRIACRLGAIVGSGPRPARVYVTDIPANPAAADAVERLAGIGVDVYWVDHHPWPDGLLDRMRPACARVEYNDSLRKPAGVLVAQWLEAADPYCARVGGICYSSERGTPWAQNWFLLLASYIGHCDRPVLERLAYDRPLTDEDLARVEAQAGCRRLSDEIIVQQACIVETASGRRMAVYDTSESPGVFIGSKVFQCHPVDFCLVHISARSWQIACNAHSGATLEPLGGCHDIHGLIVEAAGRPRRLLAVRAAGPSVPRDAHERVVDWAAQAL